MADLIIDGKYLQNFVKERREHLTLTKPGYEIYFYSRFDQETRIKKDSNASGFGDAVGRTVQLQSFDTVPPTASLISTSNRNEVSYVTSITVNQSVRSGGSTARITMVAPPHAFFQTSLGKGVKDYDSSDTTDTRAVHKMDVNDTILIRLTNIKESSTEDTTQRETVFRGVISTINRHEAVDGNTITIECNDFSQFMKRAMGVKSGIFSTIALAITGRLVTFSAVNYTNNLLSGNKQIFGLTVSPEELQKAQQGINSFIQTLTDVAQNGDTLSGTDIQHYDEVLNFDAHAMAVPPFLFLKDSDILNDKTFVAGALGSDFSTLFTDLTTAIATQGPIQPIKSLGLSLEDKEAIEGYKVEDTATRNSGPATPGTTNLKEFDAQSLQPFVWTVSDLYLGKHGVHTFEHQYMWSVVTEAASRSTREVFFDFKPKLKLDATQSFQAAETSELQKLAPKRGAYKDIHPNIGILKYRLSPCYLPYRAGKVGSQFWQYSFSNDDVISYDSKESEQNVFTVVLGYGSGLDKKTLSQHIFDLATSESKGLAVAGGIDPQLEKRLGYRFMTDSDAKISYPILTRLISYTLLMKSQLSLYAQNVIIAGRPDIQAGSIVQLVDKDADYYCTDVTHSWDVNSGYQTRLLLQYGHHTGRLPDGMFLSDNANADPSVSQFLCTMNHGLLKKYLNNAPKIIGDVEVRCFMEAMWNFWCDATTSNDVLKSKTKEYAQSMIDGRVPDTRADWIELTQFGAKDNKYDSLFQKMITEFNIDKYNVTINLIKNLVGQESKYDPAAVHHNTDGTTDYGLFQLNSAFHKDIERSLDPYRAYADAAKTLQDSFLNNTTPGPTCVGASYLLGITGYNSGPWGAQRAFGGNRDYVKAVLGPVQYQRILDGKQAPGISKFAGSTVTNAPWPYYTYGPMGIRVSQSNPALSATPRSDPAYVKEREKLLDFNTGMTAGIAYLLGLLKRLDKVNVQFDGNDIHGIDQKNLLQKVVAAWYTNEQREFTVNAKSYDAKQLSDVINKISSLYTICRSCSGTSEHTLTGQYSADGEKLLMTNHLIFTAESQKYDVLHFIKPTLVKLLSALVAKNYYLQITSLKSDHGNDGGGHSHTNGYAVDLWPVSNGTRNAFFPANSTEMVQFLKDVASLDNLHQIGLAGSSKTPANFAAAGPTVFRDNQYDHIHIGAKDIRAVAVG